MDLIERRLFVQQLPERVAHATHGLLAAGGPYAHGMSVLTAAEICVYDAGWEAITPRHTAAALREAQKHGLVAYVGKGMWMPTNTAQLVREELEERFLREEDAA